MGDIKATDKMNLFALLIAKASNHRWYRKSAPQQGGIPIKWFHYYHPRIYRDISKSHNHISPKE
jgi:hypothetical protein